MKVLRERKAAAMTDLSKAQARERKAAAMTDLSKAQARARVNRFLLSEVGSQFCAGDPELDVAQDAWRVPILFVTPGYVAGRVGEAVLSLSTREIDSHTDPQQIHRSAEKLRKRNHSAIKAAFIQARKG